MGGGNQQPWEVDDNEQYIAYAGNQRLEAAVHCIFGVYMNRPA
jgi:hypothetical protein